MLYCLQIFPSRNNEKSSIEEVTGQWIFGILLCTLMAGLLARQPTPEEEIVINRGDGVMEEKIFGDTAPSQQIEKTPHWTESLSLGAGLTLEIDCPVEWGRRMCIL